VVVLEREKSGGDAPRQPSVFCVGPDCAVPVRRVAIPLTAQDHFAERFADDFAHALEETRHDDAPALAPAPADVKKAG